MEHYTFSIDGTPFSVSADPDAYDDGSDSLGDSRFTFAEGPLADELARVVLVVYNGLGESSEGTLARYVEDMTRDPWGGGDLVLDPDAGIAALAHLSERGSDEPIPFHWDGSGSAYWLFHDVSHASEDATAMMLGDEEGTPAVDFPAPLSWAEDRANVEGAQRALRAGVPLDEILGELAGVAEAFRERFSEPSTALADFLDSLDPLPEGLADYRRDVRDLAAEYLSQNEDVSADDVDPYEWVDGSAWITSTPGLVLAFSEHGGTDDYGTELADRAYGAMLGDVCAAAHELAEERDTFRDELGEVDLGDVEVRDSGADRYSVSVLFDDDVHAMSATVNMCTESAPETGVLLDAWDIPEDVRAAVVARVEQLVELRDELEISETKTEED